LRLDVSSTLVYFAADSESAGRFSGPSHRPFEARSWSEYSFKTQPTAKMAVVPASASGVIAEPVATPIPRVALSTPANPRLRESDADGTWTAVHGNADP
jgi:hypothetical protein